MKKCILLSDGDVVLLYNVREIAKKYKIEIFPCKNIFEMLNLYNKGANAILIDDNYNFLTQNLLSQEVLQYIYFIKNSVVLDNARNQLGQLKDFFESKIFDKDFANYKNDVYNQVTLVLTSLGISSNSWKDRFIKLILCEMYNQNCTKVNNNLIGLVASKCEVKCKKLYDAIRPTLKGYLEIINSSNSLKINKTRVNDVINELYNYIFKN